MRARKLTALHAAFAVAAAPRHGCWEQQQQEAEVGSAAAASPATPQGSVCFSAQRHRHPPDGFLSLHLSVNAPRWQGSLCSVHRSIPGLGNWARNLVFNRWRIEGMTSFLFLNDSHWRQGLKVECIKENKELFYEKDQRKGLSKTYEDEGRVEV